MSLHAATQYDYSTCRYLKGRVPTAATITTTTMKRYRGLYNKLFFPDAPSLEREGVTFTVPTAFPSTKIVSKPRLRNDMARGSIRERVAVQC